MFTFVHFNTIHVHFSWKKSYRHPALIILLERDYISNEYPIKKEPAILSHFNIDLYSKITKDSSFLEHLI